MNTHVKNAGWLVAAALFSHSALADMQLTISERSTNDPSASGETVMSIRDGMVRFTGTGAGDAGQAVLFDSASGTLTQIDHTRRSYMVMDRASMDQMAEQTSAMMKEFEQQFANMPKEQRDAMMRAMPGMAERMGGKKEARSFEFEWVGGEGSYIGIPCKNAKVTTSDGEVSNACIATKDAIGISDADFEALASMFDTMAEFASRFSENADMPDMRKIGGFPIATSDPNSGSSSELTARSDAKLDAGLFAVPADYTRQSMPGIGSN
ncbi:MAG: DUF4412 domain-containing protein [Gammaproteobacteria bacterium]